MLINLQIQQKQRTELSELLPNQRHTYDIRNMTTAQTTLLIAIYDLEEARTLRCKPSVILAYFCNVSINENPLIGCLDAVAQRVRFRTSAVISLMRLRSPPSSSSTSIAT